MGFRACAIIAALSDNYVIAVDGKIPWHIPEDLRRFKRLTINHPVIMGRKTYYSILERIGKPLPERTNIVLTRNPTFFPMEENVRVCHNLDEAIITGWDIDEKIFIIGGSEVYKQALEKANLMHLTFVHREIPTRDRYGVVKRGITFFPKWNPEQWIEISREDCRKSETDEGFSFVDYEKIYWSA